MSSSNGTPTNNLTADLSKLTATNQDSSVAASSNAGDDLDTADTNDQQGTDNQMSSWTGWAELENDPLIFATLLKEWGGSQHPSQRSRPARECFQSSFVRAIFIPFVIY
jgi:hypothetical protein